MDPLTTAANATPARSGAGRLYAALIERMPGPVRPGMRRAIGWARRARHAARRLRRRTARLIATAARSQRVTRSALAPAGRWAERVSILIRNARILPGSGPVILLDARGHRCAEALQALEHLALGDARVVIVTDDPDLGPLRSSPVAYEFVPPIGIGGIDRDIQDRLFEQRRWTYEDSYRPTQSLRLDDLLGISGST